MDEEKLVELVQSHDAMWEEWEKANTRMACFGARVIMQRELVEEAKAFLLTGAGYTRHKSDPLDPYEWQSPAEEPDERYSLDEAWAAYLDSKQ